MLLTFRDRLKLDGLIPLHSFQDNYAISDTLKSIRRRQRSPGHQPFIVRDSVQALQTLIENDPDLYMGFTDMFKEAPGSLVRNYKHMILLINEIVSQPPIFHDYRGGAPGLSFNNILASVIVTPSGFNAFCNDALNEAFKNVLAEWFDYLSSKDSAEDSLIPEKWLSDQSIASLSIYLHDFNPEKPSSEPFKRAFVPVQFREAEYWGFQSWNHFFARPFLDNVLNEYRPLPDPCNENDITSLTDSRIYGIATNVSEVDTFWLKGHRYSLKHLLNGDRGGTRHKDFIGGTVYQAYLIPSDYHRWAMPFSGTIQELVDITGTYFALSNALVNPAQPDEFVSLVEGLPYLVTVSARKIAVIKADNSKIGTVCFIPVGLQEISSVEFSSQVKVGAWLEKGADLGAFKFGGSTVCMVFEPKVNIKWEVSQMEHIYIRSKIGEVY